MTCGAALSPPNRFAENICTTSGIGSGPTATVRSATTAHTTWTFVAGRVSTRCLRHALSIGGRFLFNDDGETPNTNIALIDCEPTPILCEIRGLPEKKSPGKKPSPSARDSHKGILIRCEGGSLEVDAIRGGKALDSQDKEIKTFAAPNANDMLVGT